MKTLLLFFALLAADAPDYLVVAPDALAARVTPLLEWRKEKGHTVRVLSTDALAKELGRALTAEDLKAVIRKEHESGEKGLKHLLLVGDVGEGGVPTFIMEHYRWMESDAEVMATDVPYGDMEGDLLPEIAVGRLPVGSPKELDGVVNKIVHHESTRILGDRRLRISLFAGASGYAPAVDRFLESFSRRLMDMYLSKRFSLDVIYASLASPYCPPPDRIGNLFVDSLNRGPAFSVFLGHASKRSCLGMYWNQGQSVRVCGLNPGDLFRLEGGVTSGPLFLFSCDNGFFDGKEPCFAEEVLCCADGPVCTVASSRYSHPLPNLYSNQALLESLDRCRTAGDLVLEMKREGFKKSNFMVDRFLKNAEGALEEKINVKRLKEDQVRLYNLFGDPATCIAPPAALEVEAEILSDRSGIALTFPSPFEGGEGHAILYLPRIWEPESEPLPDPERDEEAWRTAMTTRFEEVNRKEICRTAVTIKGPRVEMRFPVASWPGPGPFRLVVYLQDGSRDAAGAVVLTLPSD